MPGLKFDRTITFGNALIVLTLVFGAIGLYVDSSNEDVRQNADIEMLRGQVAAMVLYGQRIATVETKIEGVETELEIVREDVRWIRQWLERSVPFNGGQQ